MQAPRWEQLQTIEDWAHQLDLLLQAAARAVADGQAQQRLEVQKLLHEFVKESPSRCSFLDTIASQAARDLLLQEVQASAAAIAARNVELQRATGLIADVTGEAKKDARSIRLENAVEALQRASVAVEALKAAEGAVTNPDAALLAKIKDVLSAMDSLTRQAGGGTP